MNCPRCGTPAVPIPRFCCYCGAPLYEDNRAFIPAAAVPSVPSPYQAAAPRAQMPASYRAPASSAQSSAASRPAAPASYRAPANNAQSSAASRPAAPASYRAPASSARASAPSRPAAPAPNRAPASSARASAPSRPAVPAPNRTPASSARPSAASRPAAPASYQIFETTGAPEEYPIPLQTYSPADQEVKNEPRGFNTAVLVSLFAIVAGLFIILLAAVMSSTSHKNVSIPSSETPSTYHSIPFAAPSSQGQSEIPPLI